MFWGGDGGDGVWDGEREGMNKAWLISSDGGFLSIMAADRCGAGQAASMPLVIARAGGVLKGTCWVSSRGRAPHLTVKGEQQGSSEVARRALLT